MVEIIGIDDIQDQSDGFFSFISKNYDHSV